MSLENILVRMYAAVLARPVFVCWNRLLFRFALSGMGILNYANSKVSGERSFLNGHLANPQGSGTVTDVGANKGVYSLACLEINPALQVVAFEPHPKTYGEMVTAVSHQNVVTINKALGSAPGTLSLYDYAEGDGSEHATLYSEVIQDLNRAAAIAHEVAVTTLDHYLDSTKTERIDLLKIDAEGHELEVLKGAALALSERKIHAIHFEFNEMNVVSRAFFRDFYRLLKGYDLFRMLPGGLLPLGDYHPLTSELYAYQNVVALLAERQCGGERHGA